MAARVEESSSWGMPGGVLDEKVSMWSPFVSNRMLKEKRVFVGLPLLLLPTVMRLTNEKVVGRGGVSEWRMVWAGTSTKPGRLQRMASLIVAGVVCTREVMADVRVRCLSRTWSVVMVE